MTHLRAKKIATWVVWATATLLVVALLVGLLVKDLNDRAADTDHARRQIDALVTEVHDISADAAKDRRTATRERRELQRKLDAALAGQDALLRLLRANGIPLPTRFVTRIERQILIRHPRSIHHVKRRHHSTDPSPTSHGPGKSGAAPGHRKHGRHGHRGRH